jgi:hypothetical protein
MNDEEIFEECHNEDKEHIKENEEYQNNLFQNNIHENQDNYNIENEEIVQVTPVNFKINFLFLYFKNLNTKNFHLENRRRNCRNKSYGF